MRFSSNNKIYFVRKSNAAQYLLLLKFKLRRCKKVLLEVIIAMEIELVAIIVLRIYCKTNLVI